MFDFHGPRLAISKERISRCPNVALIGILHALTDTLEFLGHMLKSGHDVPLIFAKPYSKDAEVIVDIERLGIRVEQLDYSVLEETSILRETIVKERSLAGDRLILVDVGGYFAAPLCEMTKNSPTLLPVGVVEVTTFGHNRYAAKIQDIGVPVVSIARSPIKDVEAAFVGESAWFAIDSVLREVGMSAHARRVGIVGYGMIGRRVAAVARANGAHTRVFDSDPLKLLDARSFKHEVRLSLRDLLRDSEIVISATGGTAIPVEDILEARNGVIFASAGSKLQEIDVINLKRVAVRSRRLSETLTEYELPTGKFAFVLCDGAAVNFLLGSCPDQTMDLVFAETIEATRMLMDRTLIPGKIHEVGQTARQDIAQSWLRLQDEYIVRRPRSPRYPRGDLFFLGNKFRRIKIVENLSISKC